MTKTQARQVLNSTGSLCGSVEAAEARRVLYPQTVTLAEFDRIVDEAWEKYKRIEAEAYAEFAKAEKAALAKLEGPK